MMLIRKAISWLVSPHVAPLVGRLLLVALTALLADPALAASAGAALEVAANKRSGW